MDLIHATPMTFGFLTWPLRPPQTSMVLVVKATFEIVDRGFATLAASQRQCHGPIFWDDDPTQSLRLDSDFALLKPRGECLLAGTCHPPSPPVTVSAVGIGVGPIKKGIGVFGDRHWKGGLLGKTPSDPVPFESMPLRWERAFGGPHVPENPLGRGVDEVEVDGRSMVPLPNLERLDKPIAGPGDRPAPATAFPLAPTWKERLQKTGTYDARWVETRFPYFPTDFDPAFYCAAPEDQRLKGRFWTGREEITLRHLLRGRPFVSTQLPGLRPRAFVERVADPSRAVARFEEVPLVLDTITVDGDAAHVYCVWRGAIDVADERLRDVERLYLWPARDHTGRSVEGCRQRMEAHLRLRALEESGFEPKNRQEDEDARTMALEALRRTMAGDPKMRALLERAASMVSARTSISMSGAPEGTIVEVPADAVAPPALAEDLEAPSAPPEPEQSADEVLDDVYAKLEAEGIDMSEHRAKLAEVQAKAPPPLPEPEALAAAFASSGLEMPPEVKELLEDLEEVRRRMEAPPIEPSVPPEEPGARELFLMIYAEGRPIEGDFSGIDLSGEDLRGLVAERVLLAGANLAGCVLDGARLDGASLAGASLAGASLVQASLVGADLKKAVLSGARLSSANLSEAVIDDAKLDAAALDGADLSRVEGVRVDFRGALLEGAKLDEADLSQAWLANVKARGASFVEARLWGTFAQDADFTECDLTKVRAGNGSRFDRALFRGARADGARFFAAIAPEANFSFASLDGADFTDAQLLAAVFAGCRLRGARFVGANLYRATLQRSDLMKANLMNANLDDADLRGSSFFGAELFRARVSGAQLELADLSGTKLEGRR